jgi:arylformamidase
MNFIYLSYFLNDKTPIYGGEKGIDIIKDRDISNGDTANSKRLRMHNHSGTHIDFPNHFFSDGKLSHQYDAGFWIFNKPFLLEFPVSENEMVDPDDECFKFIPTNTDFLIIKTGFSLYRDEEKYWKNNPGISPNVANRIRRFLPNLRVLAVDLISITSFQNREIGRTAHRNFLGENPILLVEDIKLDLLNGQPSRIFCFPLLAEGLDGAPVTIIAETNEI